MKEKQYAIVGSNKYDNLLKMKILEVFDYHNYNKALEAWSEWKKKYKYCYIIETIYG